MLAYSLLNRVVATADGIFIIYFFFLLLIFSLHFLGNDSFSMKSADKKIGYASVRLFLEFEQNPIFDLFCTWTYRLYFHPLLRIFDQTLLRPKICCMSRPIRNPHLKKCRSTDFDVTDPKYRKGRTDAKAIKYF